MNYSTDLLVELDVSEDGVDSPGLGEHGAEREGEAGHEEPGSRRADVRERLLTGEPGVQAEEYHTAVRQHTSHYDQVVEVRAGHLYIPVGGYKQCFSEDKLEQSGFEQRYAGCSTCIG